MPATTFTVSDRKKAISGLNLKLLIRNPVGPIYMTMLTLSQRLGLRSNYLSQTLKTSDLKISLLLAMSSHLGVNLLDLYTPYLPEELQETERERKVKIQLAALEKQLAEMQWERDLYKKVVMKKSDN